GGEDPMTLEHLECKENNAAYVKRIMPEMCGARTRQRHPKGNYGCINTGDGSQKELDTAVDRRIIIFTDIDRGWPGHQAPDAPTAGNAEPAAESRPRRAISRRRLLRRARSGPGQVRDVAPGTDRGQVRDRCGGELRLFAALVLSGTI